MPATGRLIVSPFGIDSSEFDEMDLGPAGAALTAKDLAVFGQTMLNQGSYAGQRVLSPSSVAAMTRNQIDKTIPAIIPWINAATGERIDKNIAGTSYGFGLAIFGEGDRFDKNGSLASLQAFGHVGNGGTCFWADPVNELVGVYFSVSPRLKRGFYTSDADLFQNAVHAAIVD